MLFSPQLSPLSKRGNPKKKSNPPHNKMSAENPTFKLYHWIFITAAVLSSALFYAFPPHFLDAKGFILFSGLAILMEFWEIQIPKFPKISVGDALYTACLFLFPIPLILGIASIGKIGKTVYSAQFNLQNLLILIRSLLLLSLSAWFFKAFHLYGAFILSPHIKPFKQLDLLAHQVIIFALWIAIYSTAQFFLLYFERMLIRHTILLFLNWNNLKNLLLANSLLISPLGILIYILYSLQPSPFPYPLILLVPSLLIIYRSIRNYTDSLEAAKSTVEALADAVDKRLEFTHDHSPHVSLLAKKIALHIGLSDEEIELLERAAKIHNLGKVGIADRILNKPDALTEEEFKAVKKHPEIGAKVAGQLSIYEQEVEIIRSHHEHFDGSGYPKGLKGDQIPLGARILAVADAYEAMLSSRPYRKPLSREKAIQEIQSSAGARFDPAVVKAFLKVAEEEK